MEFIYDKNRFKLMQDKDREGTCLTTREGDYVTHFEHPCFLKQINANEFIKIDKILGRYLFRHISYMNGKIVDVYGPRCYAINKDDNISSNDDFFILQNGKYENTYIYNCSTRKEFQAPKFIAKKSDIVDDNNTPYIIGVKRENMDGVEDRLFMLINSETLETPGFYSELQDRFVCIKDKNTCIRDGSFMNRFFETIQEEVYPFLESYANRYNQEEAEKQKAIRKILIEKINSNKK